MNPLKTLRLPLILVGFGATLFFAPSGRAQQDTNPEFFDVREATPAPAKAPASAKAKSLPAALKPAAIQVGTGKSKNNAKATLRPRASREPQTAQTHEAAVLPTKRELKRREDHEQ